MEAIGPVLIVLSIPLLLRWVPPNHLYGFRIPATLRDRSLWYDANALCARHMLLLGVLMVIGEFVLSRSERGPVLWLLAVGGLAVITVADWRTANRWARERAQGSQP